MHIPADFGESRRWPAVLDQRVHIGDASAIYALLHEREFGRLRGASRILYIGSTGQLGGRSDRCRLRIYRYPNGRHALDLTQRIQRLLDAGITVTFCWKHLQSKAEAIEEEAHLLNEYMNEHLELPPFNRQSARDTEVVS